MSLFVCKWKKEFGTATKQAIREDIADGMAELTGVPTNLFAICFEDYPAGDFPDQGIGVFVLVCQTEGRDDAFKDRLVTIVTDAFTKHTGWDASRVSIMIHDILKGSMGHKGVIVNRGSSVAEAIKSGNS